MQLPDITIAIDGYSSTGKSTFARLIAGRFGFLYLDSGALYRGVTLFAMEHGMIGKDDTIDTASLEMALASLDLRFQATETGSATYIGDRCVERDIRTLAVSDHVSPVSAVPAVRAFVDARLRKMAAGGRVVMDGRDIGTTVFPDAGLKVFMTADPAVRARRRFDELAAKGEEPVFEDVLRNLQERDRIDSHREVSPLRQAPDAFVLDNSAMTLDEELAWVLGLLQGKFAILQ